MGCCLLAALIISVVRRAWYSLPGRTAPPVATFAPDASRPAPGHRTGSTPLPAPSAVPRRIGWPLVAALTVAAYALAVPALSATGLLRAGDPAAAPAVTRDVVLTSLIVVAGLVAFGTRRPPASRLDAAAVALTVSGGLWTVLAVIDMHVLRTVEVGHPALLADLLVHGTGLALLLTGLALLRSPRVLTLPAREGAHP